MQDTAAVKLPDPDDVVRLASFFGIHIGWSVFWDKRHGVWRASEDDPRSDLYEENADAQEVIVYVAAHSEGIELRSALDRDGPNKAKHDNQI
jgi:hypothetical protein